MGTASAAALHIVPHSARRKARRTVELKAVLRSWQVQLDYLVIGMGDLKHARVRYLDTRNRLIDDHLAAEGSIHQAAIHPREVIRREFDKCASALIFFHNHPSGDPEPTRAEIQITSRSAEA